MNKRTNYRTLKITKRQFLQIGERQNIKSYRTAKDKKSNLTKRQNTKCQILQNVK
jgi:hypothetical protein